MAGEDSSLPTADFCGVGNIWQQLTHGAAGKRLAREIHIPEAEVGKLARLGARAYLFEC
jgi:hypothetical protein